MKFENSLSFARELDKKDPLKVYRNLFYIPAKNGKEFIYLCGNSLGLQPKTVEKHLKIELDDWRKLGVEGHLNAKRPWLYYHHFFKKSIAKLIGAKEDEVVVMNQLTVNLNLMLISFYRPQGKRNKILVEAGQKIGEYLLHYQWLQIRPRFAAIRQTAVPVAYASKPTAVHGYPEETHVLHQ